GLGSRLLGSLRDTDAVLAVVRAGDDADPTEALGALELDLVLADLASVEQRLDKQRRSLKGDKTLAGEVAALERAEAVLGEGSPAARTTSSAGARSSRPGRTRRAPGRSGPARRRPSAPA